MYCCAEINLNLINGERYQRLPFSIKKMTLLNYLLFFILKYIIVFSEPSILHHSLNDIFSFHIPLYANMIIGKIIYFRNFRTIFKIIYLILHVYEIATITE